MSSASSDRTAPRSSRTADERRRRAVTPPDDGRRVARPGRCCAAALAYADHHHLAGALLVLVLAAALLLSLGFAPHARAAGPVDHASQAWLSMLAPAAGSALDTMAQTTAALDGSGLSTKADASATATPGGLLAPVLQPAGEVVGIAGDLVGVVLAQVAREGAPVAIAGGHTHVVDMRTMLATCASPEDRILGADMLRYYGLPFFGMGGASDSKVVDAQAAAEAAMTLMTEALGGANILHDVGYLESGSSSSLTQLVICDELIGWVRALMRPIEIDAVTLPLDMIRQYGVDGDYVASDHTLEHFRRLWEPTLFDRDLRTHWGAAGGRTLAEAAAERVDAILAAEPAPKLDEGTLAAIDEIIAERAARAGEARE